MALVLAAWSALLLASTETSTASPDVEDFVREALRAHPEVTMAKLQAQAATKRIAPAGAWDDPTFSVRAQNLPYDPLSLNVTPMSGIQLRVSQRIPWPGKRALAQDAARAGAAVARYDAEELKNTLAAQVRNVFFDIHLADISKEVLRTNLTTFRRFIETADTKYRVGKGLQQDVLRARVARDKLQEQLLGVERSRASLVERLRTLLTRSKPLRLPPLLRVPISTLKREISDTVMVQQAERTRPLLQALIQSIERSDKTAAVARKAALPDVDVSLSYTFRGDAGGLDPAQGADFLSMGLSVGLPVFYGRKQAPLAEAALADHLAAKATLRAARWQIQGEISSALTEIAHLERQMSKYADDIIPT
ncbi:MAG: TolC family protein, partial [Myxococcota bacterium]